MKRSIGWGLLLLGLIALPYGLPSDGDLQASTADEAAATLQQGGAQVSKADLAEEAQEAGQKSDLKAEGSLEARAFPPTISDTDWHKDAWLKNDCLRCHETGVGDATPVKHYDMPEILLTAKCRTCHVQIPGSPPRKKRAPTAEEQQFAPNAFPPMIPASDSHRNAWIKDDCLLCHESGISGAPLIEHNGLPELYKSAKCRSCHVQVRSIEAGPKVR